MIARQLRPADSFIADTDLIINPDGSVYHLGVQEDQVADDIWVVGDPERVPLISRHLDRVDVEIQRREFVIHTGELNGKRLSIVSSGIGVDNIDILINELDAVVNIDFKKRCVKDQLRKLRFLRLGTSGAIQPDIELGTIVASKYAFGIDGVANSYEHEFHPNEVSLMQALREAGRQETGLYASEGSDLLLQQYPIFSKLGITFTANGFYGSQGRSVRLKSKNDALTWEQSFRFQGLSITNFEMECAGLYGLASLLGHDALTCCVILANRANRTFSAQAPALAEQLIQSALHAF